jgi:hypothetical protein
MGAGYFPVAIGVKPTVIMSVLIALGDRQQFKAGPARRRWSWIIVVINIAFVQPDRKRALVSAASAVIFMPAVGARSNSFKSAFFLALATIVVSLVVFVPARTVWTRVCNSGGLFHGGCVTGFMG